MKKTNIITIAVLAVSLLGSVAHAGDFFGSNNRGIAIPGLNQAVHLSPEAQCQVDLNASQDQVHQLQDQVDRLTPGTCQNQCANNGRPASEYGECVSGCSHMSGDSAVDVVRNYMRSNEEVIEATQGLENKTSGSADRIGALH